jgi:hypothetical protein
VRGYLLPSLGEGTVVAESEEAGAALLKLRLATLGTAAVLPAGNRAGTRLLNELGIKLKSSASRMVRQGNDPLNQEMVFNRIGGHVG